MLNRRQNLGSPSKRSEATPNFRNNVRQLLSEDVDGEEDDDEETLQLKLAAIEAKLKLKQLQKGRGRPGTPSSSLGDVNITHSRPTSALSGSSRPQDQPLLRRNSTVTNSQEQRDEVQVPLSPTRREAPASEPWSPRRYLLGIDKGLKGSEVSLRRPPSSQSASRPPRKPASREGAMPRTSDSFTAGEDRQRPKSFSERIAESRSADKSRMERAERIERIKSNRNSAFQFDKAEVETYKAAAAEARARSPRKSPTRSRQPESFSRDDILRSYNNRGAPSLKRSQTAPSAWNNDSQARPKGPKSHFHKRNLKSESETFSPRPRSSQETQDDRGGPEEAADPAKFEAYSSLNLSNRILPHSFLTRTLDEKTVFRIPDILRTVKAPEFELPEVDGDYVVFGIVASKSDPKEVKESKYISKKEIDPYDDGLNNTNRYMAITLTDLKWTIDLFLFDTAFPRYYKLPEGMVIAILNPTIMPPPKNKIDTNRFSLVVSSSDDKILEIGYAQDIGFCKAVRKDGKTCQSWVHARKTEFCDFHVDLQVRRAQSQRMGVNSGPGMFGPGGRSGPRTGAFGDGHKGGGGGGYRNGLKPDGAQYDRETQSVFYVAPAPKSKSTGASSYHHTPSGQSAASLIDADEDPFLAAGVMGRGMENKAERTRKRLANQQRERDIAKKLATSRTGGVGAEYLRAQAQTQAQTSDRPPHQNQTNAPETQTPSKSISLATARKADSVRLGPMKRAHDGDKPHGSGTKKTRFITSKGIREAGRDSLGGSVDAVARSHNKTSNLDDDDDDDELDII